MEKDKEDKLVNTKELIIGKHECLICGKALPEICDVDDLFFCNECDKWRKNKSPDISIGKLQKIRKEELSKKRQNI